MYFIDLGGRVSFAYVPVRDQNLVVRGWNWRLIVFVFFSFENGFKMESQVANENWFVFLILKKITWNGIKSIDVWLRK